MTTWHRREPEPDAHPKHTDAAQTRRRRRLGLVVGVMIAGTCLCGALVLLANGLYLDRLHQ